MEQPDSQTPGATVPPQVSPESARCHWCGYSLRGLGVFGRCPECGQPYDPVSAARLRPWPSPIKLCLRLGWPVIGLAVVMAFAAMNFDDGFGFAMMIAGYLFLLALPFNSYFQVRSMLKRHLPEGKRTQGPIFAMRAIGAVVCILVALAVLAPAIFMGACLLAWTLDGGGF